MDLQKIYDLLEAHLDNCTEHGSEIEMKRIRLPIPDEFGGGFATGKTPELAVRNLIARLGIKPEPKYPSFESCADDWMHIKEGQQKSPSTIADYKRILKLHLKPFFSGKNIHEITADDIQLYFNSIMNLSRSYSSQSRSILKGIFERADRNGWIDKNPMQYTYERSRKVTKKVVLQDDGLFEVISQLNHLREISEDRRDYLYMCFLCFTALRRGEILGLRWQDINFETHELTVRNNVTFPDGKNDPTILPPKDDSFGVVHLNSLLEERILPYKPQTAHSTDYVIPYSTDASYEPITRSMFTKLWNRCKKAVDLKGATSHSFRASYASMMNAHCLHIDPKALQGALRHKTPDLAIKVYTKPNEDKTRLAEKEYDEYLRMKVGM